MADTIQARDSKTDPPTPSPQSSSGQKSFASLAHAFLSSERTYVEKGLRVGFETFLNRLEVHNKLNDSILSDEDLLKIFSNYKTLLNANSKLYDDLLALRLQSNETLRDNLGQCMVSFIPYFRMYTDYIVKKKGAISHLEELQKSNKKFRNFLKINERCAGRKLKSFLEEPAARLPQYLQHLAAVYEAFEAEERGRDSAARRLLLQAIVDIKAVTDEIAVKCRDLKARLLVGELQKDVFGNKIQLLAAHRFCISHATMAMVGHEKGDKLKKHRFILCNDVLLVATLASSFKRGGGQMVAVYPLIGLRVARDPKLKEELLQSADSERLRWRFALVPQNKNFTPSEANSTFMGSIIVVCSSQKQCAKWVSTIEEAVDEEEHNLKPCNPVDLEKRLRKQKTSKEGQAETITITDPEKIKEIEAWKQSKAEGSGPSLRSLRRASSIRRQRNSIHSTSPSADTVLHHPVIPLIPEDHDDHKQPPPRPHKAVPRPPRSTAHHKQSQSTGPPATPPLLTTKHSKPPNKPPPRRAQLGAHRRQKSGPPPLRHKLPERALDLSETKSTPSASPLKVTARSLPIYSMEAEEATNRLNSASVHGLHGPPPKFPKTQRRTVPSIVINTLSPNSGGLPPPQSEEEVVPLPSTVIQKTVSMPVGGPRLEVKGSGSSNRVSMLAGIRGFSAKNLKSVSTEQLQKEEAKREPQNVTNLLQTTLKNYRQFVMDDDDSDDSDEEWDD